MPTKSFISFQLDQQLFGVDIMLTREINRHLELTPVPLAKKFVRGLVNLRGQIVTVLDLKNRLGLGTATLTDVSHNIILKTQAELDNMPTDQKLEEEKGYLQDKASFLVDEIGDVVTVEEVDIEPPPANIGAIDGKYLSGIIKLEGQLLSIISVSQVLKPDEFVKQSVA
ncbi:MAG: chemotaxis protein CheW [Cyanobacteria bacterium P01_H01_bin.74]